MSDSVLRRTLRKAAATIFRRGNREPRDAGSADPTPRAPLVPVIQPTPERVPDAAVRAALPTVDEPGQAPHAAEQTMDTTLDIRPISPRERHPLIFQAFADLPSGSCFVLVNDHDPKPLYYHFQAEYGSAVGWEYLERGPETWKVRISRVA